MSKGVTQESMLSVLPGVLSRDDGMFDLAQLIGWIFGENADNVRAPAVFQNIDELDESLLDILAADCKIDWYDYDADIDTKRRQIKSNWHVRVRLGTVSAVKTALQSVWSDTTVEEWYKYSGDPGCFRVLLGVNDEGTVDFDKAIRMIQLFKPVRAHIDGDLILRIRCGIVVKTKNPKNTNKIYHVDACGTLPGRKNLWREYGTEAIVNTEGENAFYHVPPLGGIKSGEYPGQSTNGRITDDGISLGSSIIEAVYTPRICGTSLNALM